LKEKEAAKLKVDTKTTGLQQPPLSAIDGGMFDKTLTSTRTPISQPGVIESSIVTDSPALRTLGQSLYTPFAPIVEPVIETARTGSISAGAKKFASVIKGQASGVKAGVQVIKENPLEVAAVVAAAYTPTFSDDVLAYGILGAKAGKVANLALSTSRTLAAGAVGVPLTFELSEGIAKSKLSEEQVEFLESDRGQTIAAQKRRVSEQKAIREAEEIDVIGTKGVFDKVGASIYGVAKKIPGVQTVSEFGKSAIEYVGLDNPSLFLKDNLPFTKLASTDETFQTSQFGETKEEVKALRSQRERLDWEHQRQLYHYQL